MGILFTVSNSDFSKNAINKLKVRSGWALIINAKYGWCTSSSSANQRLCQDPNMGGIFIPKNGSIIISGLKGNGNVPILEFDYAYYNSDKLPVTDKLSSDLSSFAVGCLGTASNQNSNNYFPFNSDGLNDSITITNNHGNDYYFCFGFRGLNGEVLSANDYNLTWRYS